MGDHLRGRGDLGVLSAQDVAQQKAGPAAREFRVERGNAKRIGGGGRDECKQRQRGKRGRAPQAAASSP
ncbi:hypothetical protein [Rhodosalinus sp. 5P4]|uniref:hypothetical protein n=1 Tax=Rhodosalinus sp. 5P4 TaxID=3239196 RepID=UPI0035259BCB